MTDKEKLLVIYNKVKKWKQPNDEALTTEIVKTLRDLNDLIKEFNSSSKDKIDLISLKDNSAALKLKLQRMEELIANSVVYHK